MSMVYGFQSTPGAPQQQQQPGQVQQPLGADPSQQQAQNQQLADALQSLSQSGAQSKTPAALGSNLLASALLNYRQRQQQGAQTLDWTGQQPQGVWQGGLGSGFLNLGLFGGGNGPSNEDS